jgi:hypothetical protein
MKTIIKGLKTVFIIIYSIFAIALTILLLTYNEYRCSELLGYTLCIVDDNNLEPEYSQGDLLLVKETDESTINVGDKIFVYKSNIAGTYDIEYVEVTDITKNEYINTYTVEGNYKFDSEYLVGSEANTTSVHHWGFVLSVLESRWGFLVFVVIVTLLLFLQEVFELILELKYGSEESSSSTGAKKESKKSKAKKEAKSKE